MTPGECKSCCEMLADLWAWRDRLYDKKGMIPVDLSTLGALAAKDARIEELERGRQAAAATIDNSRRNFVEDLRSMVSSVTGDGLGGHAAFMATAGLLVKQAHVLFESIEQTYSQGPLAISDEKGWLERLAPLAALCFCVADHADINLAKLVDAVLAFNAEAAERVAARVEPAT